MTTVTPTAGATYLTVAEIARLLRVSKMTIYRLVHDKVLDSVVIGRSIRISRKSFQEYLEVAGL